MKVICGPLGERYNPLIATFQDLFPDMIVWGGPRHLNVYDLFDLHTPDLLLINCDLINNHFWDAFRPTNKTKIVTFGDIPYKEANVMVADPSISDMAKAHLTDFNPIYMRSFADVVGYWGGKAERKTCELGYVSNDPDTATIDVVSNLLELGVCYHFKIVGSVRLPVPQYLGKFTKDSVQEELSFLKSCKVALDVNGKNILNQVANGIFTASMMPHELAVPIKKIDFYLDEITGHDIKKFIKEAQKKVLNQATSYHRAKEILNKLDITEYDVIINNKIEEKLCN